MVLQEVEGNNVTTEVVSPGNEKQQGRRGWGEELTSTSEVRACHYAYLVNIRSVLRLSSVYSCIPKSGTKA